MSTTKIKETLNCTDSTTKDEIFEFLQNNMNRHIEILYIFPEYNRWHDWRTTALENNQFNSEKIKIIVKSYKIIAIFVYPNVE